ncbi:site-specific integrase [Neorhizobium sp. SHOUNA12B]|uniref:site-specific integrase n=1 Tax=Neorhizobium sp. SHOUNA12B TaxID=2908928 RepID=UPI0025DA92BC|nr:site-specific integrase [Neorhizobium sp. SHOUNA12B]MCJ9672764.1 hypothetical protein [Neorhizobium sp. SHOUNA12B]
MSRANPGLQPPTLPPKVISRDGAEFDPRSNVWAVRDPVSVFKADFGQIEDLIGSGLAKCLKATLASLFQRSSSSHVRNCFERFQFFAIQLSERIKETGQITRAIFLDFRASLPRPREWYATTVAVLLREWADLGYDGLSSDLLECLEEIVLPKNDSGHLVLSHDRKRGPLTEFEYQFCWAILDNAHQAGEIDDTDHLLLSLGVVLGSRPIQFAAMRVCDVHAVDQPDGPVRYVVDVPRAKNRKVSRTEFKERPLPPELGRALQQYAEATSRRFCGILDDIAQAPLFPALVPDGTAPLGWEYHQTNDGISLHIRETWKTVLADVDSLGVSARRLRYTLGTRAAQEGYDVFVIAEMLDHDTTTSTRVYVEATPAVTTRINRALASKLGALAKVFRGRIISSESEATRGADRSSRIEDYRIDAPSHTMGNCAQEGACFLLAPVACYTCPLFEPWIDGPHEAVLASMLAERERLIEAGEPRLAAILDLQIAAAAQVADMCKAAAAGLLVWEEEDEDEEDGEGSTAGEAS